MLKAINAREPYLSYIDGELVESRVSLMPVMPGPAQSLRRGNGKLRRLHERDT